MAEQIVSTPDELLNETEAVTEDKKICINELQRWLEEEKPNLHARTEAKYLLTFLRGCQFDLEETKEKIENYYTLKRDQDVWYKNRDPRLKEIQELVKLGVFVPLKTLYKNKLVVIIRTSAHDPKIHTQDNVFKVGKMLLDVAALLENDSTKIEGIITIFDMDKVTVWHAKPLTPSLVKRAVFAWRNYYLTPVQFEFVNAKFYMNMIINLFTRFMSEKMRNSVTVHSGLGNLNKVIDVDVLPLEYGGTGECINDLITYWNEKLLSYCDWFVDDEKFKAD